MTQKIELPENVEPFWKDESLPEMWAIVSLFGHKRLAGKLGEFTLGGESFTRVDIPAVDGVQAHTRLFGKGAIYSIDLVGKEIAEAVARQLKSVPVEIYEFDQSTRDRMRALPPPACPQVDGFNKVFSDRMIDGDQQDEEVPY